MKSKAFTIVELSIVLVIIGVIMGSITAGQSLITSSRIRATINDIGAYKSAAISFLDRYGYYPGDMANASSYWTGVTNGDGNGIISCTGNSDECWLSWAHLSKANMVSGSYDGINQSPFLAISDTKVTGTNGIKIHSDTTRYGISARMFLGGWDIASVQNIYKLDNKIDDAVPTTGALLATNGSGNTYSCIKQSNGTTDANYTSYSGSGVYNLTCTSTPGVDYIILPR
jgi:prepilin-type N-terminal cleavage/methylation domain-containing protein